jgi:hypothetical protein
MTTQIFKIYLQSYVGLVSSREVDFFKIFRDTGLKRNFTVGLPLTLFQDQEDGKITLPKGVWDFTIETNASLRTIQANSLCHFTLNAKVSINGKETNDRSNPSLMGFAGNLYYKSTLRLVLAEDNNLVQMAVKPEILLNNMPTANTFVDLQKITLIGTKIADLS